MGSKAQHDFRLNFSRGARDYLARRKMFRKIFTVVMVALFSLLAAGIIVYTSNPAGFEVVR
jgi:membrane protein insertase Oxa1/YidC/SpoIIIJ